MPWQLWAAMLVAVVVPTALGGLVGRATKLDQRWAKLIVGSAPAPQAWDHLFYRGVRGVGRAKLKSGPFVAGQFVDDPAEPAKRSYAAGFPNEPDLFLIHRVVVDPDTGEFAEDDTGNLVRAGSGLLVTKNEIEHLEFFPESGPGGS